MNDPHDEPRADETNAGASHGASLAPSHSAPRVPAVSETAARARSIARWARVLIPVLALGIVATAVRVVELKVAPQPELVASMVRPSGQLMQQRASLEPEPRGRILDRAGRLLAVDAVGGTIFVDVRDLYVDARANAKRRKLPADTVLDPIEDLANALTAPTGIAKSDIIAAIHRRVPAELRTLPPEFGTAELDRLPRFVVVSKDLRDAQVDAFAAARAAGGPTSVLRGAHLQPRPVRVRPFGELADSLVGKTFPDGKGMTGVESKANPQLSAAAGRTVYFATNRGHVISVPSDGHNAGRPGEDVRLSIDMVIQEIVERELEKTVVASNAGGARCIVVNVHTGEILAAHDVLRKTNRSPIAEDTLAKIDPAAARLRWMTDPFEPGSIFKPFVWGWAIDAKKARVNETIPLPDGPLTVADGRARRTIREAHSSSYGTKSWCDCLVKSVNAGMATVAMRMTAREMQDCLRTFGFGRKTGIGLDHESSGILPPGEEWKNRTRALVSVSFGQGIAVTPLQLVHAFTAFCRDGSMVPLSIAPVAEGSLGGFEPVMSEASAMLTREVMQEVITHGTGKKLKDILRFTAFGKSGTAQLVKPNGGYFDDRYISSFLLGAPFDRPELAVLVTIEDPDKTKGPHGGGALAGPCAAHIMNDALEYLGVPGTGELVYSEKKSDANKLAAAN